MNALPLRVWAPIALLLLLATVVNQLNAPDPTLEQSATTYGKFPSGFGALFDLMEELGREPRRSRQAYSTVDSDRPLWLLAPQWGAPKDAPSGPAWVDELEPWVSSGGTAVVVGGPAPGAPNQLELPQPSELGREEVTTRGELAGARPAAGARRTLRLEGLVGFDPAGLSPAWRVLLAASAPAGAGSQPAAVVVDRPVGAGRLVAVSDARLLRNEHLATADHALLAADLARFYGLPRFDERCHGLTPQRSIWRALGAWRSWLLLSALVSVAGLWLWARWVLPARRLPPEPHWESSLGRFVESLALSYGRYAASHPSEVFEAYRQGRLLRSGNLGRGSPRAASGSRGGPSEERDELAAAHASPPRTVSQLVERVRALERQASLATNPRNVPR